MKLIKSRAKLLYTIFTLGYFSQAFSGDPVTAKLFADQNGNLDTKQAAFYIIYRDDEPVSKFILPGQTTLDGNQAASKLADKLDDLRSKTGHIAPWNWQELDIAFPPKQNAKNDSSVPGWKKIDGLTKKMEFEKDSKVEALGPILLRNSTLDIAKSQSDAKGATLTYSKSDLSSGSGVLNSAGVLDYPTMWNIYQKQNGKSLEMGLDFASQWNVVQVQNDRKKEVEELTFTTPFTIYYSPGVSQSDVSNNYDSASSRLLIFQAKPYFQTDFGFRHEIYGVEATGEYVGNLFGSRVMYLGGFQNTGFENLQYQLRFIPKLDYSVTERGGIHTTRKVGDDWLRLGTVNSFDLRLGLQTFNAVDVGISYQFLQAVMGSGGYSKLLKAHTTLWLIENVGLTFEYSNGTTPVANKPIDLLSLGLELKY